MDNQRVDTHHYEVIIIGGGIVGSGIFRDLCLHKKRTLIVDKKDFNSQTSAGSSKMLHGGIRYLENLDFRLVFEALYEKNHWLKHSPHLAKELPFYLPVYKDSRWPLFLMRLGLFLYDLLSLFRNSSHKILSYKKTLEEIPGLNAKNLSGCGLYYDGVVDDAKLGLECIYDGLENHPESKALNYHEVMSLKKDDDIYSIELKHTVNNKVFSVSANAVVFALGPFTDQVLKSLKIDWEPIIFPSKGSHLWLQKDALPLEHPLVMQTKDKRVVFIIPHREAILVGTTEDPISQDQDFTDLQPSSEEVNYLLDQVNIYFPESDVTKKDIISIFSAVRPLVKEKGLSSSKISRHHKIYSPIDNLFIIAGGKYTTFRKMSQDLNTKLFKKNSWKYNNKLSLKPFTKTSVVSNPFQTKLTKQMINKIIDTELVVTKEDLIARRLSLQSLDMIEDEELKNYILNLKL